MAAADTHHSNHLLSRIEIESFVTGSAKCDDDDRWFVAWLLDGAHGGNFHK